MWSGCVTCGRVDHADWCGWVNDAMREADEGKPAQDWWPWWAETHSQPYRFTSETARAARALRR